MLKQRVQTTKPKLEEPHRAPTAHMQAPPEPMHARHELKQGSCNSLALTGQTGQHHRSDWCATCEQDQPSDQSDR
jgi:hypothetical protein